MEEAKEFNAKDNPMTLDEFYEHHPEMRPKTMEERAEHYYLTLTRPLADEKGLVETAFVSGAMTERQFILEKLSAKGLLSYKTLFEALT